MNRNAGFLSKVNRFALIKLVVVVNVIFKVLHFFASCYPLNYCFIIHEKKSTVRSAEALPFQD